jgi:hypothetical protein
MALSKVGGNQIDTVSGDLTVDTNTLFVDASADAVGINTTSPDTALHVKSANDTVAVIESTDATSKLKLKDNSSTNGAELAVTNETFSVLVNGGTRATIDSSGNMLVGTTNTDPAFNNVVGQSMAATGQFQVTRDGGTAALFNRKTSNGDIVSFRKDGSTVAIIGNQHGGSGDGIDITGSSGYIGINTGDTNNYGGIEFLSRQYTQAPRVRPMEDNDTDIGDSANRFDDIFATNGTIQTSDQNEKQQIASLTTAEITAAKAISKLFKTFKWNSSVTENGDAARTHAGVIAQEVQTVMTDAGLDAGDYAFFIRGTWWEYDFEIPPVEADEEAGVKARDAYTRTRTYYTADEAPEGATQRTRLGIRYPELLAFIGAATEQRLGDIETRLTALEAG